MPASAFEPIPLKVDPHWAPGQRDAPSAALTGAPVEASSSRIEATDSIHEPATTFSESAEADAGSFRALSAKSDSPTDVPSGPEGSMGAVTAEASGAGSSVGSGVGLAVTVGVGVGVGVWVGV